MLTDVDIDGVFADVVLPKNLLYIEQNIDLYVYLLEKLLIT